MKMPWVRYFVDQGRICKDIFKKCREIRKQKVKRSIDHRE